MIFSVDECRSDSAAASQNISYFLGRFSEYDIQRISIMKSPSEGFNFDPETHLAPAFTTTYEVLEENVESNLFEMFSN